MKNCGYCGRQNDEPAQAVERHDPEPDEIPSAPFAQQDGNAITLKCRTPGEAYLIQKELEQADIIAILPEEDALLREYKRNGYVELRVSGKAYASAADLQSAVEFQYKRVRADHPLPLSGKVFALGCAAIPVPGLLIFAWLLSNYRANRHDRMAREFKLWFLFGVASWVLIVMGMAIFAQNRN